MTEDFVPSKKVVDDFEHYSKKHDIIDDAFTFFGVRKHKKAFEYVAALLALTEDCFAVPAFHLKELVNVKRIDTIHNVLHRLGDYRIVEIDRTTIPHIYCLTARFEKYLRSKL